MPDLRLTDDDEADRLLSDNPLALLIGMLLDQQMPMERAFVGPQRLAERMDGELDAATIVATGEDRLEEIFSETPAIHRFPSMMAGRTLALCQHLLDEHGGDAAAVWEEAADARDLLRRLKALPGFGDQKARVFLALLGKQLDAAPEGWEERAGDYGQPGYRSIADVTSPEALQKVRETKRKKKS